jgi:soluble lytic murein transglycosylase-like protein
MKTTHLISMTLAWCTLLDTPAGAAKNDKPPANAFPTAMFQAWKRRDCAGVARHAARIPAFHLWRDWALDLELRCRLENREPATALLPALRSKAQALALEHADSPLEFHALPWLGQIDLLEARNAKLPLARRMDFLERGFERLLEQKRASMVRLSDLRNYGEACRKAGMGPRCRSWLNRLFSMTSTGSPEERTLLESAGIKDRREVAPPLAAGNSRLVQTYKDAEPDVRSLEEALKLVREKKTDEALLKLTETLEKFPKTSSYGRIQFWLARLEDQKGEKEHAATRRKELLVRAPFSWYGLHSALTIGQSPSSGLIERDTPPSAQDGQISPKEQRTLDRARALIKNDLNREATLELRELRARDAIASDTLLGWIELAHQAGGHSTAFSLIQELLQRGHPPILSRQTLESIFPAPRKETWDLIIEQARAQSLDPYLVLALIKQESAFDDQTYSSAGATGYMQLMPFTALEMIPGVERNQLNRPEINLQAGTRYLRRMLDRYQGSVPHALAAYNAGPAAVDKWLKEGRDQEGSLEAFIENIPFNETRNYVGSILRNRWWYGQLLEKKDFGKEELFGLYRATAAIQKPSGTQ